MFSDFPPPQDVPERNILKRPPGAAPAFAPSSAPKVTANQAASVAPTATASTPRPAASAPKLTGKDMELEKKKAQAEAEEAAKKKAEDQKQAAAKAESCERARRHLASLQSGVRIAQLNAQGEREFLSDEGRQAEMQRSQAIISSDCR